MIKGKQPHRYDFLDCGLTNSMDIVVRSITMGPLQDHGGPTYTYALLANSLAVSFANASACPQEDQRGAPRLAIRLCDIGAFQSRYTKNNHRAFPRWNHPFKIAQT